MSPPLWFWMCTSIVLALGSLLIFLDFRILSSTSPSSTGILLSVLLVSVLMLHEAAREWMQRGGQTTPIDLAAPILVALIPVFLITLAAFSLRKGRIGRS